MVLRSPMPAECNSDVTRPAPPKTLNPKSQTLNPTRNLNPKPMGSAWHGAFCSEVCTADDCGPRRYLFCSFNYRTFVAEKVTFSLFFLFT